MILTATRLVAAGACLVISMMVAATALPGSESAAEIERMIRRGHVKRARVIAERRYQANPKLAENLWLMSLIKHAWGDRTAAQDFAEKAVRADRKDPRFHLRLAEVSIDVARKSTGDVFERMRLADRFKSEIEATLALDPNNVAALREMMQYLLAAPAVAGGDKDGARKLADQIMKLDPVEGYFAQARIAKADAQEDRIDGLYRKAIEVKPASYEARIAYGAYLISSSVKKYEGAVVQAAEALRLEPDRIPPYNLLATCLCAQKKWKELDDLLVRAEEKVPDNLSPYYYAAMGCIDAASDYPRAEKYLEKYLGTEPEPVSPSLAMAHYRLGRAKEQQGRVAEAIAEYRLAVSLDPDSPAKKELTRLKA